ncbi:MAG TPA: SUMF1/EgtB/PvdO family nonheme iron enzyme [Candidatus Syntrophosphaera sp.]|nr:SUMF1/EgtB/PvdO family nonheme iron enzyme [Candidatus Syntrophosphaera sp.]
MLLLAMIVFAHAARKALVIANATYADTPLRNPVNDANLVSAKLTQLGFLVTKVTNANLQKMDEALNSFVAGLTQNDEAVFYYSGHGANVQGENFLIPVGRTITYEEELKYHAFSCNLAMEKLQRARISVLVLDACRDNPFKGVRSGSKGLANMQGKAGSQYIIFATEQGRTAADGTGSNSPFTESFVKYLGDPAPIEQMMKKVSAEVRTKTNAQQVPWTSGNLIEDFCFAKASTSSLTPLTSDQYMPEVAAIPNNFILVEGGSFQMGSNDDSDQKPVHQVTLSSFWIGKYEVTQKEWQEVMGSNPSNWKGDNLPVESVSWYAILKYCNLRSIVVGLTPVYSISGSTNPANWGDVPTSNNATWNAVTCNWSANGYRLPTEAEWEFSARGGTQSKGYKYSGSNDIGSVAWYYDNSGRKTHEVGTKTANELGIHDMSGNVWEWCWDWYDSGYYAKSPVLDPRGAGSSSRRVLRGGSWLGNDFDWRVAFRNNSSPDNSYNEVGLRLARAK